MFLRKTKRTNASWEGACIQLLIVNFHDEINNKSTTVEKCVHIC